MNKLWLNIALLILYIGLMIALVIVGGYSVTQQDYINSLPANQLVIIEVYGDNCPACDAMSDNLDEIGRTYPDIKIIKIDALSKVGKLFPVFGVPTILMYLHGNQLWRYTGMMEKSKLEKVIEDVQGKIGRNELS
jgi:thiol-disulfide isomerase/thioredoxin